MPAADEQERKWKQRELPFCKKDFTRCRRGSSLYIVNSTAVLMLPEVSEASDEEKEQYPDQRTCRICYDIIHLAESSSRGKLDEFQEETAGKPGKGAADDAAK